jgi:hypothetical protein
MSDQVQCPNCGGYRVQTTGVEKIWNREVVYLSEDEIKQRKRRIIIFGIFTFGLGFLLFSGKHAQEQLRSGTLYKDKDVGEIYHFTCWICGYKWDWQTGTPKPTIKVRPDLIAAGEQRLREEEAAANAARANAIAQDVLRRQG